MLWYYPLPGSICGEFFRIYAIKITTLIAPATITNDRTCREKIIIYWKGIAPCYQQRGVLATAMRKSTIQFQRHVKFSIDNSKKHQENT